MLAPRRTPKLEYQTSSAVRGCLFNLFTATLHIGGRSSIRNPRTRHAVVTGTNIRGCLYYKLLLSLLSLSLISLFLLSLLLLLPPIRIYFPLHHLACHFVLQILGAFAKLRKVTTIFVMSVSVLMKQLCSHLTDFYEI